MYYFRFVLVCGYFFVLVYGATNSLRTVLIKPFKPEFICDDFRKWLEKAVEYEFKKDRGGDS